MEYKLEEKICQNCKNTFTIEPNDFVFYEKIKVPAPTFCFHCRAQRRLMFRNERSLYKRDSNTPGKSEQLISIHRPGTKLIVYDDRFWWSDKWDPMDYGQGIDFSHTFFDQFKELYRKIPLIALSVTNNVNCSFCNVSEGDKGCYMLSGSERNEDTIYGNRVVYNKQSADLYIAFENELCYELINCTKCYKTLFSVNSQECVDSYFLLNCKNCTDCIGCVNQRNQSNCIFNKKYEKQEYETLKKGLNLDTREGLENFEKEFKEFSLKQAFKFVNNVKSEDSTGDNLVGVTRSKNIFDMQESENLKNCFWGMQVKDSYDSGPGIGIAELLYEVLDVGLPGANIYFSHVIYNCFDVWYSINCHSSKHLFGCYGLRSKEYCIFNKQYTKQEYEKLVEELISHMNANPYIDKKGRIFRFGEFFPYDISPFCYNETVAQEYFPLSKEEAEDKGFNWYTREDRNYQTTVSKSEIPNNIRDIKDSFINEIIECASGGDPIRQCTQAFRVTIKEIEFYKKLNIPLPKYCYNCRHYNRLQKRNSMKLWHRKCMCDKDSHGHIGECNLEFETTYAPERKEIIYCEKCYQKEVY